MKVTSDKDQFILGSIKKIILSFKDGCDVRLNHIVEYDFDFDTVECSYMGITNALIDKEILNRFRKRNGLINFIHIEINAVGNLDGMENTAMIDIPCKMYIRELRTNGDHSCAGYMFVRLEGDVK